MFDLLFMPPDQGMELAGGERVELSVGQVQVVTSQTPEVQPLLGRS